MHSPVTSRGPSPWPPRSTQESPLGVVGLVWPKLPLTGQGAAKSIKAQKMSNCSGMKRWTWGQWCKRAKVKAGTEIYMALVTLSLGHCVLPGSLHCSWCLRSGPVPATADEGPLICTSKPWTLHTNTYFMEYYLNNHCQPNSDVQTLYSCPPKATLSMKS